ncbi:MAG: IS110 family transposase [Chitinophagaceae bacterium]|nr:IS110 family transposase [Chitinophagaceae bacterium]
MNEYDFIGIDIAKEKFDIMILRDKSPLHKVFENKRSGFKACVRWLKSHTKKSWACMESTGHYGEPLAEYLSGEGIQVSVVNPLQIKNFAKAMLTRNKNDKLDAKIIGQYCQQVKPRVFSVRSEEQKEIREMVQLIESLKEQLVRLKYQSEAIQTGVGKKAIKKVIRELEKQIKLYEKELNALVKNNAKFNEQAELLMSIKGIGNWSAYCILAYLPDLTLFNNAKQFAAYVGVTPRQYESGKMKKKTCLTQFGHKRLKKILYMPALSAKSKNEHLKPFVERLEKSGLSPKAIVCAVMRKLAHLIFGILTKGQPFDPALACAKS